MKELKSNKILIPLPCGCIIGAFECGGLQRLHNLRDGAYHLADWRDYEKYRKASWEHLGLESPEFD